VVASLVNLTVHGVGSASRSLDPGEERVWVTVAQFEQVMDAAVGRDDVRITFDDGNDSDVEIALPRLLERGLNAEFFVPVGLLEEPGRLTTDAVGELMRAGMQVNSHGWAHRDWRQVDDLQAVQEIDHACWVLGRLIGQHVSRVSIPFGSYDRWVLERLRCAGITRAYTSDGGRVRSDAWLQARNSLTSDLGPEWIAAVLDGVPSLHRRARNAAATAVKRVRPGPRSNGRQPNGPTVSEARWSDGDIPSPPCRARIGVVIVTYNSARVLAGCLDSLVAGSEGVERPDVVVVDNASSDESLRMAKEFEPLPIQTIQMGHNAGYAAGVNAGIRALKVDALDAVLIINPDCRLRPGVLAILVDSLTTPHAGIAVPKLINPDGSIQPSLRRAPAIHRALAEAVLGEAAGRLGTVGELVYDPVAYEHAGEWAWATGAAMLLSTAMISQVGEWDESFLLYSEETDFSLRAADHGWRLWYEPRAIVEHIGGDSATNPMLAALIATNRVRLFRRRRGATAGMLFYAVVLAGEGIRALLGRRTSRAAVLALVRPSRRIRVLPA
jgi:GT2 family glycosyltransferase/peptidoglycan/xylan/chitin deacetylase (PgdA/CDA1 family)